MVRRRGTIMICEQYMGMVVDQLQQAGQFTNIDDIVHRPVVSNLACSHGMMFPSS